MYLARFAWLLACVACGGGSDAPAVDAPPSALCTGAVYDPCTTADQCGSMQCHAYTGSAIEVCTQTCNATTPCPNDAAGKPVACNMMGTCKPSVANDCHR